MNVIIDTSVLSLAFRRKNSNFTESEKLKELIESGANVCVTGIVIQELLQGIKSEKDFQKISYLISGFSILSPTTEIHILAAKLQIICMKNGVTVVTIDFLIAALAIHYECRVFTTDKDFHYISQYTDLRLF